MASVGDFHSDPQYQQYEATTDDDGKLSSYSKGSAQSVRTLQGIHPSVLCKVVNKLVWLIRTPNLLRARDALLS